MRQIKRNVQGQFIKGSGSPRDQNIFQCCLMCGRKYKTFRAAMFMRTCCSPRCSAYYRGFGRANLGQGAHGARKNLMKVGYFRVFEGGKWVYEHRHVMSVNLGRPLTNSEVVHHIDGDRKNNNLQNLELMSKTAHDALHSKKLCAK